MSINTVYSEYKQYQDPEYKIVDDQVVRFSDICVHEFAMGDVEDPDLYAAQPIWEWQKTEHGKWCMEHAVGEPIFHCSADPGAWGFRVTIVGDLEDRDCTYLKLKWGK